MNEYALTRYEVVICRRGEFGNVREYHTYGVWADSDVNAAFQAGATHVAEGKHAADMEVIAIRSEAEANER